MKNLLVQRLVRVALLVALTMILQNYLGIHTSYFKIGFAFVPIALCAMLYGPLWAGGAAAAADFLGWVVYPIGPYFPPLTASAFLTGVIFGLCLKRRVGSWKGIVAAVVLNQVIVGMLANTWFLSILYDTAFPIFFVTRIPQFLILIPLQIAVLKLVSRPAFIERIAGVNREPEKKE